MKENIKKENYNCTKQIRDMVNVQTNMIKVERNLVHMIADSLDLESSRQMTLTFITMIIIKTYKFIKV